MTHPDNITSLFPGLTEVLARVEAAGVIPLDPWHLVALLEADGWNDAAARQWGYEDLFDLGHQLYPQVARAVAHLATAAEPSRPWYIWAAHALWQFVRGLVFAMPMLIASWATLSVGISLWSYVGFGVPEATGIALATIGSFLATGGFTQALARRGLFYTSWREYRLARFTSSQLVKAGLLFAAVMGLAMALLLLLVPVLRWPTIRTTAIYYPFLSLIWLFLGLLYMLQRELVFTGVVAAGVAIAYLLYRSPVLQQFGAENAVIAAHVIALSFTAVASGLLARWFLRLLEQSDNASPSEVQATRWAVVGRLLFPYWLYGVTYFAFLFVDRIMAWSTPGSFHPQAITFIGPYELGLNWAALALLLPMGWVEMGIHWLLDILHGLPVTVDATRIRDFNDRIYRGWIRLQAVIGAAGVFSLLAVYAFMVWLDAREWVFVAPLTMPVAGWVFFWGAVGYVCLAGALFNVLLLLATNQPWPVLRATAYALLTDAVVSFLASRFWYRCFLAAGCTGTAEMLRYPQAVIGFPVAAILFWWLAARYARKALSQADYLLYLGQ